MSRKIGLNTKLIVLSHLEFDFFSSLAMTSPQPPKLPWTQSSDQQRQRDHVVIDIIPIQYNSTDEQNLNTLNSHHNLDTLETLQVASCGKNYSQQQSSQPASTHSHTTKTPIFQCDKQNLHMLHHTYSLGTPHLEAHGKKYSQQQSLQPTLTKTLIIQAPTFQEKS